MTRFYGPKEFDEAADYIREHIRYRPTVGIILGSGLSDVAAAVEDPDIILYPEIPHFPASTVEGHQGDLVIGRWEEREVLVMRGRGHYYEGYPMSRVTLPVRVMRSLGIDTLVVTNAAGGLNPTFRAGDLMLITDHINFVGMAGVNPLRGPNDPNLGPRFPDMSRAYDPRLRQIAMEVAHGLGLELQQGVYVMLAGPSFETPAEIRFLRSIGADAVGMSTAPEVVVARHGGMRVLGISLISNVTTAGTGPTVESETTHEEVLEAGKAAIPKMKALLAGVLRRLD